MVTLSLLPLYQMAYLKTTREANIVFQNFHLFKNVFIQVWPTEVSEFYTKNTNVFGILNSS
jgi:hypothetical protein